MGGDFEKICMSLLTVYPYPSTLYKTFNPMMIFRKILYILPLVIAVGCGGDAATVTGTVKLADGAPLTAGTVTFESATTNVVGNIDGQGRFSLFQVRPGDRVPPGAYRGSIFYDTSEQEANRREGDFSNFLPFPQKYTSFDTSGLTLTVEPKKAVHLDIVLE